jgi:hypothetical protein
MMQSVHDRYAQSSDQDLLELVRDGESAFRPEAWDALQREVTKRQIQLSEQLVIIPELRPRKDPVGLGGWLILFQAQVSFMAIAPIPLAVRTGILFATPVGRLLIGYILITLVGLYLMASRRRSARRFWIIHQSVMCVLGMLAVLTNPVTVVYFPWPLVWAIYWARSRRVRLTFTR